MNRFAFNECELRKNNLPESQLSSQSSSGITSPHTDVVRLTWLTYKSRSRAWGQRTGVEDRLPPHPFLCVPQHKEAVRFCRTQHLWQTQGGPASRTEERWVSNTWIRFRAPFAQAPQQPTGTCVFHFEWCLCHSTRYVPKIVVLIQRVLNEWLKIWTGECKSDHLRDQRATAVFSV